MNRFRSKDKMAEVMACKVRLTTPLSEFIDPDGFPEQVRLGTWAVRAVNEEGEEGAGVLVMSHEMFTEEYVPVDSEGAIDTVGEVDGLNDYVPLMTTIEDHPEPPGAGGPGPDDAPVGDGQEEPG